MLTLLHDNNDLIQESSTCTQASDNRKDSLHEACDFHTGLRMVSIISSLDGWTMIVLRQACLFKDRWKIGTTVAWKSTKRQNVSKCFKTSFLVPHCRPSCLNGHRRPVSNAVVSASSSATGPNPCRTASAITSKAKGTSECANRYLHCCRLFFAKGGERCRNFGCKGRFGRHTPREHNNVVRHSNLVLCDLHVFVLCHNNNNNKS